MLVCHRAQNMRYFVRREITNNGLIACLTIMPWFWQHFSFDDIGCFLACQPLLDYFMSKSGLVWFYGISTIVGHLMTNPFYTYIKRDF